VVAKVALGLFAALAIIGGAMLTVMVAIYFGANEYVPELNHIGGWGILAGAVALGVYVGGVIPAHPAVRALIGVVAGFLGLGVTSIVATVVSLTAHRGGPRGNLEDGSHGFIWMVAGLFFVWALAKSRWPVRNAR
jgi:hypothetical protein